MVPCVQLAESSISKYAIYQKLCYPSSLSASPREWRQFLLATLERSESEWHTWSSGHESVADHVSEVLRLKSCLYYVLIWLRRCVTMFSSYHFLSIIQP